MATVGSILVFRVGLLGDTLVALPAIDAIRKRFPGRRLVLLTSPPANPAWVSAWDVLGPTGWFADVVFYEPALRSMRQAARLAAISAQLRRERFESAFVLAPPRTRRQALRDRFFFRILLGIPLCFSAPPLDVSRLRGRTTESEGMRLLRIVDPSARAASVDAFRLRIPASEREGAMRTLLDAGIRPAARIVALAPGSRMPAKHWPEERFRSVGAAILAAFPDVALVAIGGAEEQALCRRLCAAWGARAHNLAGRLSVFGSATLLARSLAYVGNDSGPMHLAAMVGTPCVAVFSAREARGRWDPFGAQHILLRKETECAGCMLEECEREANRCLTGIGTDEVARAAVRAIREAGIAAAAAATRVA